MEGLGNYHDTGPVGPRRAPGTNTERQPRPRTRDASARKTRIRRDDSRARGSKAGNRDDDSGDESDTQRSNEKKVKKAAERLRKAAESQRNSNVQTTLMLVTVPNPTTTKPPPAKQVSQTPAPPPATQPPAPVATSKASAPPPSTTTQGQTVQQSDSGKQAGGPESDKASPPPADKQAGRLSGGAEAAIVLGMLGILAAITFAIIWYRRRKRSSRRLQARLDEKADASGPAPRTHSSILDEAIQAAYDADAGRRLPADGRRGSRASADPLLHPLPEPVHLTPADDLDMYPPGQGQPDRSRAPSMWPQVRPPSQTLTESVTTEGSETTWRTWNVDQRVRRETGGIDNGAA